MRLLALLSLATAVAALPLGDNLFMDSTKKLPLFSNFGNKKMTKATGHGKATGTGNFLKGLTEFDKLSIPKRDASPLPIPSELTTGVQGGEVVKRDPEAARRKKGSSLGAVGKSPLDFPLGKNGIEGTSLLKSLPPPSLGILKRWLGFGDGGEENGEIEKRQGKVMKNLGKGGMKQINKLSSNGAGGPLGNTKLLGLPVGSILKE